METFQSPPAGAVWMVWGHSGVSGDTAGSQTSVSTQALSPGLGFQAWGIKAQQVAALEV